MTAQSKPPVLILGGQENTLSLTRSFGRRNISTYISAPATCLAFKSRYCSKAYPVPSEMKTKDYWAQLLLNEEHSEISGSVIFAGNDEAVEFIAAKKSERANKYVVDDSIPQIHIDMLNKQRTLELAKIAGCPTPSFYNISELDDVKNIGDDVMFPIMIKPIHSHLFRVYYPGKKYLTAHNREELVEKVKDVLDKNLSVMATEIIPGPDDLQSSFFTYITDQQDELFHYTHQIVRRRPKNSGNGCLHISKKLPATASMGRLFFNGIGFQGFGHIEFKLDLRDNKLKIIECNPRASAAQEIVTRSGLDMAYHIYRYLTQNVKPKDCYYSSGVRRWWLLEDILAFRELNKLDELSLFSWLKSVFGGPIVFPYFSLSDPLPFLHKVWSDGSGFIKNRVKL